MSKCQDEQTVLLWSNMAGKTKKLQRRNLKKISFFRLFFKKFHVF